MGSVLTGRAPLLLLPPSTFQSALILFVFYWAAGLAIMLVMRFFHVPLVESLPGG